VHELFIVLVFFSFMALIVLGARFLSVWRTEAPDHWASWCSPNMFFNIGTYLPVVLGRHLNKFDNRKLLKARNDLRLGLLIFVLVVTAFILVRSNG
jgi:hypothetical protein|tara:strand:- start:314 stop:601 length:288 start_codon:yes stop_codon:yes gene_type:complete